METLRNETKVSALAHRSCIEPNERTTLLPQLQLLAPRCSSRMTTCSSDRPLSYDPSMKLMRMRLPADKATEPWVMV